MRDYLIFYIHFFNQSKTCSQLMKLSILAIQCIVVNNMWGVTKHCLMYEVMLKFLFRVDNSIGQEDFQHLRTLFTNNNYEEEYIVLEEDL